MKDLTQIPSVTKLHIFCYLKTQKVNCVDTLITRSFTDILFPPEASCNKLSWVRNLPQREINIGN